MNRAKRDGAVLLEKYQDAMGKMEVSTSVLYSHDSPKSTASDNSQS